MLWVEEISVKSTFLKLFHSIVIINSLNTKSLERAKNWVLKRRKSTELGDLLFVLIGTSEKQQVTFNFFRGAPAFFHVLLKQCVLLLYFNRRYSSSIKRAHFHTLKRPSSADFIETTLIISYVCWFFYTFIK